MFEKRTSLAPVIRFLHGCIAYEATMAGFAAVVVFSAGSRTAVFPFLFACGGVLCLCLMLFTMQAAARGDVQRYPYGTGRLENVSAILLALLIAVGTLIPFVQVLQGLWTGKMHSVQMGSTFLLLLVVSVGNTLYAQWARRLRRSGDNPILSSLHHLYHAGAVRYSASCAAIGLCWLFKSDSPAFMSRLDSLMTLVLSFYSLSHFLPQIWINFRALADFPLDEPAQLKVMTILARHFEAYDMLGRIFSTYRGSTPVFEVELRFRPDMSLEAFIRLEETMRKDFQEAFTGCLFRIIPY